METGLSTWSEMAELRDKYEDLEGRARRCNIRILGVPETPGSSSTTSVSKLLRDMLQLDKDVLIDRSHRSLAPRKPGGKPRVIVAKLFPRMFRGAEAGTRPCSTPTQRGDWGGSRKPGLCSPTSESCSIIARMSGLAYCSQPVSV